MNVIVMLQGHARKDGKLKTNQPFHYGKPSWTFCSVW